MIVANVVVSSGVGKRSGTADGRGGKNQHVLRGASYELNDLAPSGFAESVTLRRLFHILRPLF